MGLLRMPVRLVVQLQEAIVSRRCLCRHQPPSVDLVWVKNLRDSLSRAHDNDPSIYFILQATQSHDW
jgi:hypothetical protein